jgi:hypothetical protein
MKVVKSPHTRYILSCLDVTSMLNMLRYIQFVNAEVSVVYIYF